MWICLAGFFDTYGSMISTLFQVISTLALILTLGVLIWYAITTWLLRQETVRQTELKLRPYLILTPTKTNLVYIENIGNGHALDVFIEDKILKRKPFFYRFNPCHLVRQSKKVKVGFVVVSTGEETDERVIELDRQGKGFPFFKHHEKRKDYSLTISYKNIEGKRYYTRLEVRVHEDRIIIKRSEPHS